VNHSPTVFIPLLLAKIAPQHAILRFLAEPDKDLVVLFVLLGVIVILAIVVIVLGFDHNNGK